MLRTLFMIAVIGMLAFAERVSAQDHAEANQTVTFAVMSSPSMAVEEPAKRVTIAPLLDDSHIPTPVHVLMPRTDVLAEAPQAFHPARPVRRVIVTITD